VRTRNEEKQDVEKIPSKAFKKFPQFFRQKSENSNIKKATRWFASRHLLVAKPKQHFITSTFHGGRKKCALKTLGGRGRKRAPWVEWLHEELLQEFERLSSCGVKFSNDVLQLLAKSILENSEHDTFKANYFDPLDKKQIEIMSKITYGWVTMFMERFDVVQRKQTGKLLVSSEKQLSIEKNIAYHLGQVKRDFDSGVLDENLVENADETHFVDNMDSKKTLALKGAENVKYADVVGGGEGMTLMVRVTGGVDAKIYALLMIFTNKDRNYPIRGVPDDVPGVCYRTGPKGWMDRKVFVQWLEEKRANPPDKYGRKKVIFMDNCSGHNDTPESIAALNKLNAELRRLPPNATDLCQPADSFIISKYPKLKMCGDGSGIEKR
jgi:DDE superfamily endonuclease